MEGYGSQGSAAIDGINDVSEFFEDSLIPGQKGLVVFMFEIQETKQLDLRRVLRFFDIARIRQAGRLKDLFSSVSFVFKGFDADPRAIHEIPEIRAYVRKFYEEFPYWFFVWEPTGMGLPEFLLCLLDNVDVIRSDRWQNQAGTHFDLRELEPILNRLTNAASDLAKGVLTNREYYGRMKQIVRILQIPQQFVEPRFRD
jgi:hypothetical protein